jgi:lipoprotein-anchoring transpeptidase ErfK/SrfK
MIIDKDPHARWSRFILLDYPNDNDTRRYKQAVSNGTVPKGKNGHPGTGGAIGIHGSDREAFNRAGINWTLGCISMLNPDVKELDTLVSIGTMVYIHE